MHLNKRKTIPMHGPTPVQRVAREQILRRLYEAVALVEAEDFDSPETLADLVDDLTERVDALALVTHWNDPPKRGDAMSAPRGDAVSVLRGTAMRAGPGEPVSEFLLIPFGRVTIEPSAAGESFEFSPALAAAAEAWFTRLGRKLAIDYEHQSFDRFNTRQDGLRPAAGWIGGLAVRDDGLWAVDITWTERARELLRSGEYRYFSPVIFWTDDTRREFAALGPVALTNDPAMHNVTPLAATRAQPVTGIRESEACAGGNDREARDGEAEADIRRAPAVTPGQSCDAVDAFSAAEPAPNAPDAAEFVPRVELIAAEAEITSLRRQLAAQEADAFIERGLRLGKIVDATSMDWRAEYLHDALTAEARLARAPVILPPGRMLALDRRGDVTPISSIDREFQRSRDALNRWGVGPDDLAAYERAAQAGRVTLGGARAG